MPELPEVETVVRTLAPYLVGRRIVSARFTSRFVTPGDRKKLARRVAGRRIESVSRRGKFIVVGLDKGDLVMHLGMTGKLLSAGIETTHTYGVFTLDDGVLLYEDPGSLDGSNGATLASKGWGRSRSRWGWLIFRQVYESARHGSRRCC